MERAKREGRLHGVQVTVFELRTGMFRICTALRLMYQRNPRLQNAHYTYQLYVGMAAKRSLSFR